MGSSHPRPAEAPSHRPGPADPASPDSPHLTLLSALRPPPRGTQPPTPCRHSAARAPGLALCVPGLTSAHLQRPPDAPQAPVTAPPCCCRAPPRSKATLACGLLCVETLAVASQRPCQARTVPSPGDRQATGLGEVKSGPVLPPPPPPRASLSASRAAPSRRAAGVPGSLPSRHPLTSHGAPGALGTPSWESGVPWSLAPGWPSLRLRGPLWRVGWGGRLAQALQLLRYQPVSAQGF